MKFFCVPLFGCKYAVVDSLDYSQQHLEDVPKEIYRARKFLEELNLNVNKIESLPPEFFRCIKLKKLDVSENKLKELPPEIGYLQCLMDLNISNNGKLINLLLFRVLSNGFSYLEFVDLPEELGHCINMVTLNISTNIVPGLPKSIVNLTQLTSLVISNNPLTQLPNEIDQLANLQHLDAGQCELRFLPNSIVHLRRLRILDLCENYLAELPDGMNGLISLETLDIRKNMLCSIPHGLLGCTALKNLDLADNSISQLPPNIGDLTRLNELSLCDNKINAIPSSIGQMKYLESLKMARNCLDNLTPAICSCYELRDLSLSDNKLTELPSSLGNLKKLRFFDASNNLLTKLPTTIGGCAALGVLSLRQNKLKHLPMEIGRLEKLKVLDVANNDLTFLPYTITVLYESKNISALWLSLHQPPLPKLTPTYEPTSNVKVLTCMYLPQNGENVLANRVPSKSCVGGARVCFSSQLGSTNDGSPFVHDEAEEDEDDKLPIGKFERYDTPHPKPFAPKNRLNRNSGDFTQQALNKETVAAQEPVEQQESRPLRSVLKRRPVSTYSVNSQDEAVLISQLNESRTKVIDLASKDGQFGWNIAGGGDSALYKGKAGFYVSYLLPDGPAQRAGFQIDDRLLEINETTLTALYHEDFVQLVREAGPNLRVKFERIPEGDEVGIDLQLGVSSSFLDRKSNGGQNPNSDLELPVMSAEDVPRPASRQFQHSTTIPTTSNLNPPLAEAESSATTPPCLSPVEQLESKPVASNIISLVLRRDQGGSAGFSITGNGDSDDPIRISDLTPNGPAQRSGKLVVGDRIRTVNGQDLQNMSHHEAASLLRSTGDICLVVERSSITQFPVKPTLSHARSLPSLIADDLHEPVPFSAPPLPPRRASSRVALLDEADFSKFDFKAMIKDMKLDASQMRKRDEAIVAAAKSINPMAENIVFNVRNEQPLATSSPIPPQPPTSKIPVISNGNSKVAPPPVAPKPKLDPEKMEFRNKLQNFQSMIATNNGSNIPAKSKGPLPAKKPLVSQQDCLKLKEDESRRMNRPVILNEHESSPSDPNYEHILTTSIGPSVIRTKNAENRANRLNPQQNTSANNLS
ncbi:hypothetical protein M3Y97_00226900 [Aphelenchoides bicaudatus]|nr:hypothetical protein M3Y97_00226900 [Aphelenchoides bicaudatus]